MSDRDPVTIDDFRNAWNKIVRSEDESKDMPVHPFGSFRHRASGTDFCNACRRQYKDQNQFKYGSLCLGKRRWWFFGRFKCPRTAHLHVRCSICNATWFESLRMA